VSGVETRVRKTCTLFPIARSLYIHLINYNKSTLFAGNYIVLRLSRGWYAVFEVTVVTRENTAVFDLRRGVKMFCDGRHYLMFRLLEVRLCSSRTVIGKTLLSTHLARDSAPK